MGESYERAYTDMVRVQQMAELDEVVEYQKALQARTSECHTWHSFSLTWLVPLP